MDRKIGIRSLLILAVSLFLVFPVLQMIVGVFWLNGPTLSHITSVFGDITWTLELARNSFCLAFWTVLVCLVPAIPLGFLLFRTRLPGRAIITVVLILAAAIPMFVISAAWTGVIGNDYWFSMDSWYEKIIVGGLVQAIAWFPWATLLCGVVFCSNDTVHEESSLLDTDLLTMFFKVSLPSAFKGLLAVALLLTLFSLCDITVTDCVRLSTFQQECYTQFQLPDMSIVDENFEDVTPRRASAVALPYIVFLCTAFYLFLPILRKDHSRSPHGEEKGRNTYSLGGIPKGMFTVLAWGLPLILLGLPLFRLFAILGDWSSILISLKASSREIGITLLSALASACIATVIATIWSAESASNRFMRKMYGGLTILLLTLPAPLIGISIIVSLNNDIMGWLYSSPAVYTYAYILRFFPFAYLLIYPEVKRIAPELREESLLAGAGYWQYLLFILVPSIWRGLSAAFLLTFILGLSEIGASFLVQSPGYTTLSVRFFTMIHSGMDAGVAALCLVVIATTALPAGLFTMVIWRRLNR